jgi:3,4-dihydroxy 2-butanone 4-phosphate synthase/GTP cyclohydrolase II
MPITRSNRLNDWFKLKLMRKATFARRVGVTSSYVTQLCREDGYIPWPSRDVAYRIAVVTHGAVTPNDLAGYEPPGQMIPGE